MRNLQLLVLFLFVFTTNAQYSSTIRTDRPGQTIGAFTVGKGVLQLQQGVHFAKDTYSNTFLPPSGSSFQAQIINESSSINNVIRYGLSERFELNAVVNYAWNNQYRHTQNSSDPVFSDGNYQTQDFSEIDFGGRVNILDGENKAGIALAFQAHAGLYRWFTSNADFPEVKLNTPVAREFAEMHFARINFGYTGGDYWGDFFNYGANYTLRPTSDFGISLEYSASSPISSIQSNIVHRQNFQLGLLYVLTDNIQLDAYTGYLKDMNFIGAEGYTIGIGISWRVRTIKG